MFKKESFEKHYRGALSMIKKSSKLSKDSRTIFIYNINRKAIEKEIFQYFTKYCYILDLKIIKDKVSLISKGMAYLELYTEQDFTKGLSLTGKVYKNYRMIVKGSESERNIAWETASGFDSNLIIENQNNGTSNNTHQKALNFKDHLLIIRNLDPLIREDDFINLLSIMGKISKLHYQKDDLNSKKIKVTARFNDIYTCKLALRELGNLKILDSKINTEISN
uniref:Splicing factor cc1-like protein n=1 Tax=Amorphochlora amoebiformis TaxID=1561963 RepID=A0A0H5BLZ9_9EUKA|nr:splicing factor cc1-like protein [Amorphochlora amoebiformis]